MIGQKYVEAAVLEALMPSEFDCTQEQYPNLQNMNDKCNRILTNRKLAEAKEWILGTTRTNNFLRSYSTNGATPSVKVWGKIVNCAIGHVASGNLKAVRTLGEILIIQDKLSSPDKDKIADWNDSKPTVITARDDHICKKTWYLQAKTNDKTVSSPIIFLELQQEKNGDPVTIQMHEEQMYEDFINVPAGTDTASEEDKEKAASTWFCKDYKSRDSVRRLLMAPLLPGIQDKVNTQLFFNEHRENTHCVAFARTLSDNNLYASFCIGETKNAVTTRAAACVNNFIKNSLLSKTTDYKTFLMEDSSHLKVVVSDAYGRKSQLVCQWLKQG